MFRFSHWPRSLLAVALFVSLAASAGAQQPDLDALARKTAEKIRKEQKRVAIVFNFRVGKEAHHPLGELAAKDFIAALRRVAPALALMDQASATIHAPQTTLLPEDMANWTVVAALGALQGAEVGVSGTLNLSPTGAKLKIVLLNLRMAARLSEDAFWQQFAKLEMSVPMTADWEALRDAPAQKVSSQFEKFSVEKRDSHAECAYCPDPSFTDDARQNHIQGKVVIILTVNSAGDPENLFAIVHPGHGLEKAAQDAVQRWKFKPARHKDGTPFATRIMVEVTFRLK